MRSEGARGGEQNLGGIITNLQLHLSFFLVTFSMDGHCAFGYH